MVTIADQKQRLAAHPTDAGLFWITLDGKNLGNPVKEEIVDIILAWLGAALADLEERYPTPFSVRQDRIER